MINNLNEKETTFKVEPLSESQLERLQFLLNDWSHGMKKDSKNFIIGDILHKMKLGVPKNGFKKVPCSTNKY